jgi:VCBS repeat-containing protein
MLSILHRYERRVKCVRLKRIAQSAVLSIVLTLTVSHGVARVSAVGTDALPYSAGFLVTGDYVVGGVDLTPAVNPPDPVTGLATGTITIAGVPNNADIVGAYLYWETIFTPTCLQSNPDGSCAQWLNPADSAQFNGNPISPTARKASSLMLSSLGGNPATCWTSAGTSSAVVTMFRADVLPLLPKRMDANNQWTGKYYANGSHTVSLLETAGNHSVNSSGATLVLVYRDPTQPLRKVVIFDGVYALPDTGGVILSENLRGFYKSSSSKSAKLTYLVGGGGNNQTGSVWFGSQQVSAGNPFPQTSPSSDRSWANPTYDVSQQMPGTDSHDGFGETANTTIQMANANPKACRTSAAVIFSTAVADVDGDGIPDGLEDAPGGLNDPPTAANPLGDPLPNLNAMGANSGHKDLFVEFNAMQAAPGTAYGSVIDPSGHNHLPTPDVLKMLGDAYASHGVTPHFDVGDPTAYHNLGPGYACSTPVPGGCADDQYLVPTGFARGGEQINEVACATGDSNLQCQFPGYPGTVGWKIGLQVYRDQPVDDSGQELTKAQIDATWRNGTHRRRFDWNRHDYFHYVLLAHARGQSKSPFPCLDANNSPTGYTNGVCSVADNPDFHVPFSASGIADLPGGNVLITLGLWDNFLGTPFVQASTLLHELGHNLGLWHGGLPAIWGDKALGTVSYFEPNCKPNYLSSMSYLFQVHGLRDADGGIHLDYSSSALSTLDEGALIDGPFGPPAVPYLPTWYAPSGSPVAQSLGGSPATRFCNGARFNPAAPPASMTRVQALSTDASVDWDGDPATPSASNLNVNFDGNADGTSILSSALYGFDDWSNIRLDQIGAGRHEKKYSDNNFSALGGTDFLDLGSGDFDNIGSGDFDVLGSGDFLPNSGTDFLDLGSGNFLNAASGQFLNIPSGDFDNLASGDFWNAASGDFDNIASGDFFGVGGSGVSQELDVDAARGLGRAAPFGVKACVIGTAGCAIAQPFDPLYHRVSVSWKAPTFGQPFLYHVLRKRGNPGSSYPFVEIGTSSTMNFTDTTERPNGVQFTYVIKAEYADATPHATSGASNASTITAIDDAPIALGESYTGTAGATLNVATATGVLANDTDDDSPHAALRAVVATGPAHGSLTLNSDGSFSYTPAAGFVGTDTFTYVANDGSWSDDATVPMSGNSAPATVTITVTYVFANVQNLPPSAGKSFSGGASVTFKWQYTNAAGTPLNSAAASPEVLVSPVSVSGLPPGWQGDFTLQNPGPGNSWGLPAANSYIWQFSWKLTYTGADGKQHALPTGTYVLRIKSNLTGQMDPNIKNADGTIGAEIVIK